ncbi:MAG: T9SS type A sorting domain-containing protein [Chitinophagales bacterium]|nr:T9SS type A sorting domain-containing protein [Chitinophagales bacterium]
MMRSAGIFTLCFFISNCITAQVISTEPVFPTATTDVTIIFDAAQGNAALAGYTGDVFAHTGVITDASTSPSDWKNVQGVWGTADPEVLMTSLGDDKYSIAYNITDFYGLSGTEIVYQMAFVFRNADGSIVGREADGSDIYADVYEAGLNVTIISPSVSPLIVDVGEIITVNAASAYADTLKLFVDGVLEAYTLDSVMSFPITATGTGSHLIVATAKDAVMSVSDSISYFIIPPVTVADVPPGMLQGINYINDTSVLLVLYAPFKENVFAIGDYSNWDVNEANFMNIAPDGKTYWKIITGLEAGKEYAFQYLIDGTLKVADPLTEKVLDPSNDPFIPAATYPDLMVYPNGKTTGVVSVFQTAQEPYEWIVDDFIPPATTDLVIYELLVRDFSAARNYQTLIDTLDYLETLGINAIELMPVMEFEGNESWGYNPSFFTALDKYYGTKEKFKEFVDACHQRGMAVILDIALNHAFSQCPLAQMWWDPVLFAPSPENPYLNQVAKHDYNVGYDFNHESDATKKFRTLAFRYWIEEYNVDGYRFDLSKGYTQNNTLGDVGAWGAYDASRIAIWYDIQDSIQLIKDNAILILEHFANNDEEKELANNGFLLWGNSNYNFNECTMGWAGTGGNGSLSWASYLSRGWNDPHVVTYAESHDEERLMFKNLTFGNSSNPDHNAKDLNIALLRMETAAAFLFTIPGPKMIWQFGELGYDISIDYGCRVCNKPVLWNYFTEPNRYHVYQVYSALAKLKTTYDVFRTTDFSMDVTYAVKRINLNDDEMNATVVGNFEVNTASVDPNFQHNGWWYEYFSNDSINVTDVHGLISLEAGAYRIYTDVRLADPDIDTLIENINAGIFIQNISVYPNPSASGFMVQFESFTTHVSDMEIINAFGQNVYTNKIRSDAGANSIFWDGKNQSGIPVQPGMYFCRIKNGNEFVTLKFIVQ